MHLLVALSAEGLEAENRLATVNGWVCSLYFWVDFKDVTSSSSHSLKRMDVKAVVNAMLSEAQSWMISVLWLGRQHTVCYTLSRESERVNEQNTFGQGASSWVLWSYSSWASAIPALEFPKIESGIEAGFSLTAAAPGPEGCRDIGGQTMSCASKVQFH